MTTVKKVPSKGLHRMWFREDAQRDLTISREEWEKKWGNAFTQYCGECMEKHGLQEGKCPRVPGKCDICGKDDFVVGRMSNDSKKMEGFFCDQIRKMGMSEGV